LGDDQSGKLKIVSEEAEPFVCLFVVENDVAQILRIVVGRFYACETNCLIAAQPRRFIDSPRLDALKNGVTFWTDDEEGSRLGQTIQPCKIEEPTIHDGEASGLRHDQIEHIYLVHFAVGNVDK
jgi:hypothetical protein